MLDCSLFPCCLPPPPPHSSLIREWFSLIFRVSLYNRPSTATDACPEHYKSRLRLLVRTYAAESPGFQSSVPYDYWEAILARARASGPPGLANRSSPETLSARRFSKCLCCRSVSHSLPPFRAGRHRCPSPSRVSQVVKPVFNSESVQVIPGAGGRGQQYQSSSNEAVSVVQFDSFQAGCYPRHIREAVR